MSDLYKLAKKYEPALKSVEKAVKALATVEPYEHHYATIRDIVQPLVGWERGRIWHWQENPYEEIVHKETGQILRMVRGSDLPDPIVTRAEAKTSEEEWLRTSEAYDAVTDYLLALDYRISNEQMGKEEDNHEDE